MNETICLGVPEVDYEIPAFIRNFKPSIDSEVVAYYATHTFDATRRKFNIVAKGLRKMLAINGVPLRSKREDASFNTRIVKPYTDKDVIAYCKRQTPHNACRKFGLNISEVREIIGYNPRKTKAETSYAIPCGMSVGTKTLGPGELISVVRMIHEGSHNEAINTYGVTTKGLEEISIRFKDDLDTLTKLRYPFRKNPHYQDMLTRLTGYTDTR